jgi:alpha-L-fucosidase
MSRLPLLLSLWVLLQALPLYAWEATWESLDSRPLPSWYDEAKFGIFIHWGVFSVPSYGNEWFWEQWQQQHQHDYQAFVNQTEIPRFSYTDYAHRFDATLYNPQVWADAFSKSGAQYVVLTSKHHEGFCNWDSRSVPATWNWNAMDIGPRRDLVGDLSKSVKAATSPQTKRPLKFGVYHSLFEWFHPGYLADKKSNFTTSTFVDQKTMPELYDLVQKYQPELIWSDGDWEASSQYWKSTDFLAWYATHSPVASTAVWNDRWGNDATCKHGGYITCEDRYQPGKLVEKKWENALTVDATSWGFNRNASYTDYLTTEYFIHQLIETVALNGNMLLNVGPAADGTISPIFFERLFGIGEWLTVNGDAIYATRPWKVCQKETNVYYTTREDTLYAIVTAWPQGNRLVLRNPKTTGKTRVQMLGWNKPLEWTLLENGIEIRVPPLTPDVIPCQHAWTFALTGISNLEQSSPSLLLE